MSEAGQTTTWCCWPSVSVTCAIAARAWTVLPKPMSSPSRPRPAATANFAPNSWYRRRCKARCPVFSAIDWIRFTRSAENLVARPRRRMPFSSAVPLVARSCSSRASNDGELLRHWAATAESGSVTACCARPRPASSCCRLSAACDVTQPRRIPGASDRTRALRDDRLNTQATQLVARASPRTAPKAC